MINERSEILFQEIVNKDVEERENLFTKSVNNKQFGSILAPEYEAELWADNFYDIDKEIFIVIGTGRLHYHKSLCKKINSKQKIFILDWHNAMIGNAFIDNNIEDFEENIIFGFGESVEEAIALVLTIFDKYMTKEIKFGYIPPYEYFFADQINFIEEKLKSNVAVNLTIMRTRELFGLQWAYNLFENIDSMLTKGIPFKQLTNNFFDIPAIVISAGPSLINHIPYLSDIKDKALLIASGSSIDTLRKYNITPHFLTSFDGGDGNYEHFKNLDTSSLRLIFTSHIYHKIVEEFKGTLIPSEATNRNDYALFKDYGAPDLGDALIGPSVANYALDIAVKLGCNPIILIGQDLSFKGGKSHADGNAFQMEEKKLENHIIKVKGNYDETVNTTKSWFTMLKFFENQIRNYPKDMVINSTDGGAYIEGTVIKEFTEVIKLYMTKEYPFEQMIDQMLQKNKIIEDACQIKQKHKEDLKNINNILDEAIREISKLKPRLLRNVIGKYEQKKIDWIKRQEDRLRGSSIYKNIILEIIHGQIMYFERYFSRLAANEPEKVEKWVIEYQEKLFYLSKKALDAYLVEIKQNINDMDGE